MHYGKSGKVLEIFLRIGIIGLAAAALLMQIKYIVYIHNDNSFYIHSSAYVGFFINVIFPLCILLFTVTPKYLLNGLGICFLCFIGLIKESLTVCGTIQKGVKVIGNHFKDLADDSYQAYGYERTYWSLLVLLLLSLGLILGYILLLVMTKKKSIILQRVSCGLWGVVILYELTRLFIFSGVMNLYYIQDRVLYYDTVYARYLRMAICMLGIWLCVKRKRIKEERL